jgi:phosphinothricin acetyltransferase
MKTDFIPAAEKDLGVIREIYEYYITHTTATFRKEFPNQEELRNIYPVNDDKYQTFIIRNGVEVVGYCSYGPYKKHGAYGRTAEIAVYLRPDKILQGFGKQALRHIEKSAREKGIRVLLAFVTAENEVSTHFIEKQGYERCAHFKNIGEKFNRVLDVVVYQKEL